MVWRHFERQSSPIDWCEINYQHSPNIAEFFNTYSNILFFLLPPILIQLFRDYSKIVNPGIHLIWILFVVVGLSSAYFHATLSLMGQLLDEISIIWVFMSATGLLFPVQYMPKTWTRKKFRWTILMLTVTATFLSFWHPAINAFVLMLLALPTVYILCIELKREQCPRVYRLGVRCTYAWILAVICWINDRLFCDAWTSINFPYLHSFWHILIFISSYSVCVLFAYYSANFEVPQHTAILKFWPKNDFEYGIPYVVIKCDYKDKRDISLTLQSKNI